MVRQKQSDIDTSMAEVMTHNQYDSQILWQGLLNPNDTYVKLTNVADKDGIRGKPGRFLYH